MGKAFTSLAELRTEIDLLKIKKFQQEEELKEELSNPAAIFKTITSVFKSKKSSAKDSLANGLFGQDLLTYAARFAFPLLLNGTIFKRTGFITKSIVTFLSQKAAKKVPQFIRVQPLRLSRIAPKQVKKSARRLMIGMNTRLYVVIT